MKNILRDKFGKFKSLKINLLDGQRRGEVIFRRLFVLLVGALIIYLLLLAFVGKKDQNVSEVEAKEEIEWEGDQKVVYDDGKKWYIYDTYTEPVEEVAGKGIVEDSIRSYIKSYGGKIDDDYLTLLREYCDEDTLKVVVAISVAESSMGKNTSRHSNYFGWFAKGNRNYDPSRQEMAQVICTGIAKSYMNIGYNRQVTEIYTGGDRVETWTGNFRSAFESM